MRPDLQPFVVYGKEDVSTGAPRMSLEMRAYKASPEELSLTLPYSILFSLSRPLSEMNGPFSFPWNPHSDLFAQAKLILLHVTGTGLQRVHVDPLESASPNQVESRARGSICTIPPGGETKMLATLPFNYQRHLKSGEKYELFWPGGKVDMWNWGDKFQLESQTEDASRLPDIIVPASDTISFTAKDEAEPWPDRPETSTAYEFMMANMNEQEWRREQDQQKNPRPASPSPLGPSDRVVGAPILDLQIECSPEWTSDAAIDLVMNVKYNGQINAGNARPFTFHTQTFLTGGGARQGLRLYQLRDGSWKRISDDHSNGAFGIFDDPPVPIIIGGGGEHGDRFATLQPGETWTHRRRVQTPASWTSLPDDVKNGDKFKFMVKGAVVDWWDWGTKEDHRDTTVKLPCWIAGDVVEPADNGGRPKLVVPASNEVFFSYKAS